MQYISHYSSPLGRILLAADKEGITGLWFENQKYYAYKLDKDHEEQEIPVFEEAKRWLSVYFSGREPDFMPPLNLIGTEFQKNVWEILRQIPYGQTMTYGEIARKIAEKKGVAHMSAQAVGSAVGHNPISILVPCHRVVGTNGSLTGYAGGIEKKQKLLSLENVPMEHFFVPKKQKYTFARGTLADLPQVYTIIDERIRWMDEVGIEQWNVTDYWDCYPKSYYEKAVHDGNLYVLKEAGGDRITGVAVLYESDERWAKQQGPAAYYVHHLATRIGEKGAGKEMLAFCEKQAAADRKEYLRLDCAIDNPKINAYYDKLRYDYAGTCVDGKYAGNLREKKIR